MYLSRSDCLGHVGLLQVECFRFKLNLAKRFICTQKVLVTISRGNNQLVSEIEQFVAVYHFCFY